MQRRTLLKAIGATTVLGVPMASEAAKSRNTLTQTLDLARWSDFNLNTINQVLKEAGKGSPHYNAKKKPYAVFDWDNTCIMNDCEEVLMMYQIRNLNYKLTPDEFAEVVRQDIPDGAFGKTYLTVDGKPVLMEDIAADLEADYRWMYANYQGWGGAMTLEQIRQSDQFNDFRAKMFFTYEAVCDVYPIEVGYKWIIYFYKNFTPAELQAMAEASNDYGLGDALHKVKLTSPQQLPGKAGVVATTHFTGIRIHEEMRNLMTTLRANGIDVYVSTASIDDVVRVFAGNPKYGYGVPPENVIGLRLEMKAGKYDNVYRKGWQFNWGPGKTEGIKNVLVAAKGYGPLMVMGDSDGDAWMMRDFADTKLGIIVNRLKGGEIGANSKKAAEAIGQSHARFILQGRNEHIGVFLPEEKTLKFGKTETNLLA
ncbi:HAD family hydrolase [Chitinimonas sp. BJB300]|uniref:HAD family hydrolase n=1 Tax=Chitinimonas sp. BJB300 TaxID=1559339 RepID=UPI000C10966A|nr:HAD family hydrolase [Chitinimonas sp. BJB300]PHV10173.1 phosphoserine phosphatase [Chitinimonas sp. BJB300]TSJ91303.1 haloacid dehalogenase-like hydrolase [Chitinimonas sp. BJB300]